MRQFRGTIPADVMSTNINRIDFVRGAKSVKVYDTESYTNEHGMRCDRPSSTYVKYPIRIDGTIGRSDGKSDLVIKFDHLKFDPVDGLDEVYVEGISVADDSPEPFSARQTFIKWLDIK